MERTCEKCGVNIDHKNKGAKYCSSSCRVSHFQKEKRALETPTAQIKRKLKRNVPKLTIWMLLIVLIVGMAPVSFSKCAQLYREYEIGKQAEELVAAQTELKELKIEFAQKVDAIEQRNVLSKKYSTSIYLLNVLLNEENAWMGEASVYTQFEKKFSEQLSIVKKDLK